MAVKSDEGLAELLRRLDNFEINRDMINKAESFDRALSTMSPEDLFEQFTI
jgi:hypothetical protein